MRKIVNFLETDDLGSEQVQKYKLKMTSPLKIPVLLLII